ncbi:unnamed protein product [Ectocarpus sp. 12 AP-2014]
MDATCWMCQRCGHEVPIDNREVHEAQCRRNSPAQLLSPPAAAARPVTGSPPSPFDPDDLPVSRNVFTPAQPPAAEAAAPTPSQPWREVDIRAAVASAANRTARAAAVTSAEERERRQQEQLQQRQQRLRRQVQEWEQRQDWERSFTSSSSTDASSDSGFAAAGRGAAAAAAATGARGASSTEGEGKSGDITTTWACAACTYLNNFGVSRCDMCGTRMSPQQRPPDATYRDTLIGGGGSGGRRRRHAGAAGDLESAAEEARCRMLAGAAAARDRNGVSTSGGGSGGRGGEDDQSLLDGRSTVSGAAAGSAIGAIGGALLSAVQPGARASGVMSSMFQGALMGGMAGAALGGLSDEPGAGGSGGSGGSGSGGGSARSSDDEFRRQRRRQVSSVEFVRGPTARVRRGRDVVSEVESLMLARRLEALSLPASAAAMRREGGGAGAGAESSIYQGILRQLAEAHNHDAAGGGAGGGRGASPACARAIAALPGETLTAGALAHLKDDGRQCCICLEDFEAGERATRLPCLHLYHTVCIENWLQTSGTCPQCKFRVD